MFSFNIFDDFLYIFLTGTGAVLGKIRRKIKAFFSFATARRGQEILKKSQLDLRGVLIITY